VTKRYWGAFVDSDEATLFKNSNRDFQKPFFGQVARIMGIYSYQDKDMEKCLHYCDIAMKDENELESALNLKLEALSSDLKNRDDSVKFINNLKEIYAQHSTNDALLERIYNLHNALGEGEAAIKVLNDALAVNPENFVALADLGINKINTNPAEAEKYLRKAFEVKSDNALIATYLATCLSVQAQELQPGDAKRKALYEEAVKYFDKAKELDPDKNVSNWGYNRYNAYYNLYGEDDARTKQAEAEK
jgi:tetratricopeptide (TPR) repeat protein